MGSDCISSWSLLIFLLFIKRKILITRSYIQENRSFVWAVLCFCDLYFVLHNYQDKDQDSLLVKRRNDNHSPGPVIREFVPSSYQRSELSNTILCIFSRWDKIIGEGIPIPDSIGEEATFINICISNGSLKCHRVLISSTPSFGDMVICWYTGFT